MPSGRRTRGRPSISAAALAHFKCPKVDEFEASQNRPAIKVPAAREGVGGRRNDQVSRPRGCGLRAGSGIRGRSPVAYSASAARLRSEISPPRWEYDVRRGLYKKGQAALGATARWPRHRDRIRRNARRKSRAPAPSSDPRLARSALQRIVESPRLGCVPTASTKAIAKTERYRAFTSRSNGPRRVQLSRFAWAAPASRVEAEAEYDESGERRPRSRRERGHGASLRARFRRA